ncbi:MAG: SurA N-terminal domain-containing protein [Bacteroidaceae bacterium]|nr:SurA N-terminal domain-containing protein [Bacteroidaceae bacterium]
MAVLQKIRSHGTLLLIVVGAGLLFFIGEVVLEGIQSTSNQSKQEIGEVNGNVVYIQDYQNLVDEFADVIKMSQGLNNLNEDQMAQIQDQVWNTYVTNKLLEAECEKLGLRVTDKELQDIINEGTNQLLMQTPFINQQTGAFDKDQLTNFLAEYSRMVNNNQLQAELREYYQRIYNYWSFIEKTIRQNTLQQKYQSLLAGTFISNPIAAKANFEGRTKSSDVVLAAIPYTAIADSTVKVSDAEITKVYEEQKDAMLQNAESRSIRYIDVQVTPSQTDKDNMMTEMSEYTAELESTTNLSETVHNSASLVAYNNIAVKKSSLPSDVAAELDSTSVGSVVKPYYTASDNTYTTFKYVEKVNQADSIEFRQIQVETEKADSVFDALKAGASFEEMAKKYGQEGTSTWLTGNQYESVQLDANNAKFVNTLLTAEVNNLQKVDLQSFVSILEVKSRKAYTDKYNVAIVKKELTFSQDTYRQEYNAFSSFVASNTTIDAIMKNAEEKGYRVLERTDMFNNEHKVCGISSTRDAMKWIFDAKVGEVSPLYECGDNDHMLVVMLTGVHKAGYRSFESMKEVLRPEAIRNKKAEQILAKIGDVKSMEQAKGLQDVRTDSVKHITFSASAFVPSTLSSEPALSGKVQGAKPGEFVGPFKGNGGVLMFQVYNNESNEEQFDEKAEMQRLQQSGIQAASSFTAELYQKAKVVDNRYLYF